MEEIKSVQTKSIGFAPILRSYFERCRIAQIIDENVPLDPRRKILTHGEACIGMITGILCRVMPLYNLRKFAENTTFLDVVLSGIRPKEYFDDRLGDTLDAIFMHGLGNLEMLTTKGVQREYG